VIEGRKRPRLRQEKRRELERCVRGAEKDQRIRNSEKTLEARCPEQHKSKPSVSFERTNRSTEVSSWLSARLERVGVGGGVVCGVWVVGSVCGRSTPSVLCEEIREVAVDLGWEGQVTG